MVAEAPLSEWGSPTPNAAPGGWLNFTVGKVGVRASDGGVVLWLQPTNGSFTWRWYGVPSNVSNAYLSIAMTAISATLTVWAYVSTTDQWGTVQELHLQA